MPVTLPAAGTQASAGLCPLPASGSRGSVGSRALAWPPLLRLVWSLMIKDLFRARAF